MNKKYEFTGETIKYFDKTLHRIRALIKIEENIKAGDLGGWIEREENLSQNGKSWVSGHAQVMDNARVAGHAWITNCAQISGNALISGNAFVSENARVESDAWVTGNAQISGNALISGHAQIAGRAWVTDNAWVTDYAQITGNRRITGNARITNNARIIDRYDYVVVGPVGPYDDYMTFCQAENGSIIVACKYFNGTIDEFEQTLKNSHGDNQHSKIYITTIQYIKNILQ